MKKPSLLLCFLLAYASISAQSLFTDDFKSNKNNWLICNNAVLSASMTPNGYTLNNKSESGQTVYHELPMNPSGDFSLETTITRDLAKETYGFGLMFGGRDPGNIYQFFIEVTGHYTFYKLLDNGFVQIIPWTIITGVKPIGVPNTIKVDNRKGVLHFFVNGKEVGQHRDFHPYGNLIGFSVGNMSKITVNKFVAKYVPAANPIVMLDSANLPNTVTMNEDFNDNYMQWDFHKDHSRIKDGYYELSNPRDSYLFWEDYSMFKVQDFAVETELRVVAGSHGGPVGLLLGIKGGAGHFLDFSITANGFLRLGRSVAWEEETLVPWKFTSAIKSNGPNVITATRRNDSLYFYINRRLVLSRPNVELAGNGVGWLLTNDIRRINVDYLRIRQPFRQVRTGAGMVVATRERMSDNVNSPSEELNPVISPDGGILYFSRDDNPEIQGLEKDDIFFSEYKDGQWGPAVKMGPPLNNNGDCGVISVSADNRTLLLRGDYDNDDRTSKEGLYISHKTGQGWEKPSLVEIKGYENKDNEEDFFLSSDKTILLSSFENNNSSGERDLFVSFLQPDDTWSEPLNLGNVVNTSSNDFSPFLAADNVTLYYSSFGMPSYGKADIYVTRRLDDTWKSWSPPLNLGDVINTELNDQGFALAASGTEAYISSEKNTAGKADLFKVTLPPPVQPQPVVLIYGKVFDATTGETMGTEITYEDLAEDKELGNTESNADNGEYKIILPYGEHYGLNANRPGYMPLSENIDIAEKKSYQEIHVDLYMVPVKAGQNIVLKNLFFLPGSPAIAMKSYPELRKMVGIVKQYPSMKITIAGHTDDGNGESRRYLEKLSVRRAEAVKNYFVTHGISSDRIQTVGYGKDKPVALNDTNENRQKNRRVEFIIDSI